MPVGGFLGALPTGPLVGRDEELGAIVTAIDTVEEGAGHLLLLAGQHGVGKTRLAQQATLIVRQRGFVIACGRCYQSDQAVPYFPFLDALAMAFAQAPSALRSEAPRRWPSLSTLLPDEIVSQTSDSGSDEPEAQQRLFRAVAGFMDALAEQRPVALLIDDLHAADEASLRLLGYLARSTRGRRILIVGTYRDTELVRGHPLDHMLREVVREHLADRVAVRRLSADGTAALVAATVGDVALTEEFTEFVHRRTRGVPFLIEEMLCSLGGHYRLVREIGAGGMGRVFEALDTRTNRSVAIKIMFSSRDAGADATLRFEQEGAVLAGLEHPNIVKVYGTFMQEHASFIVMELLEGESLAETLRSQRLDLSRTKKIARQITAALVAAHAKGIVHRDIKPDNIMVMGEDDVRVTDFGIARVLRPEVTIHTMTSTGMTLGTPLYMAPEQIDGRRIDGRADIYALGAVLYQMVTGRPPFEGEDALTIAFQHVSAAPQPPSQINPAVPTDWDVLILRTLAKDPTDRYQTTATMEKAISSLTTESEPATSRRVPAGYPASPAVQRPRTPLPRRRLRALTPPPLWTRSSKEEVETDGALAVQKQGVGPDFAMAQATAYPAEMPAGGQSAGASARAWAFRRVGRRSAMLAAFTLALVVGLVAYSHRAHPSATTVSLGRAVPSWGMPKPGSFDFPAGVAVGGDGIIYVADQYNNVIRRLSAQGIPLTSWGTRGNGPGQFQFPTAVTLDRQGNLI